MENKFQFVDGGAKVDKATRKLMRIHVMKGKNAGKKVYRRSRSDLGVEQTPCASLGEKSAKSWEFIDVALQNLPQTRQLIRVYAAKGTEPKIIQGNTSVYYNDGDVDPESQSALDQPLGAIACFRKTTRFQQFTYIPLQCISRCGPVSILGAGRIDPFGSLPSGRESLELHESFDYFNSIYLLDLQSIDEYGVVNPISKVWIPEVISKPLLFHGAILSAATALDILHDNKTYRLLRTYHEGQVIKELREALKDLDSTRHTYDEILMGIAALAVVTNAAVSLSDDSPFDTIFIRSNWINIPIRVVASERHSDALYNFVNMKGGLEKLLLPYVASTISSAIIEGSTAALKSSPFPYIPSFSQSWKGTWNMSTTSSKLANPRLGFLVAKLAIFGFGQELLNLSYDLCKQTARIQAYSENKVAITKFEMAEYKDMRYDIQHRLITLPELRDDPIYESYRCSLWIYSFAVTFGSPFYLSLRQRLVVRLVSALEKTEYDSTWSLFPEALLWTLFLGGITSKGLQQREWFVKKTSSLFVSMRLTQWTNVKSILNSFLWLDLACDVGGRALYAEASLLLQ